MYCMIPFIGAGKSIETESTLVLAREEWGRKECLIWGFLLQR